ncbi:MAG TPA: rod-binding protein [Bryobacterales bacterium]|nr:rod-binding protein [Bryobacterales bacterium]
MSPEVVAGGLWDSAGLSRLQRLEKNSPAQTAEAARQFEALLIAHLLKTMREAGQDEEEKKKAGALAGGDTYLEMADQALSLSLAERGGFGLARFIQQGLERGPHGTSAAFVDKEHEGKTAVSEPRPAKGAKPLPAMEATKP